MNKSIEDYKEELKQQLEGVLKPLREQNIQFVETMLKTVEEAFITGMNFREKYPPTNTSNQPK